MSDVYTLNPDPLLFTTLVILAIQFLIDVALVNGVATYDFWSKDYEHKVKKYRPYSLLQVFAILAVHVIPWVGVMIQYNSSGKYPRDATILTLECLTVPVCALEALLIFAVVWNENDDRTNTPISRLNSDKRGDNTEVSNSWGKYQKFLAGLNYVYIVAVMAIFLGFNTSIARYNYPNDPTREVVPLSGNYPLIMNMTTAFVLFVLIVVYVGYMYNYGKVVKSSAFLKSVGIPVNVEFSFNAVAEEGKGKFETIPVTGSTLHDSSKPETKLLKVASRLAAVHGNERNGITPENFVLRFDDEGEVYMLSRENAAIHDEALTPNPELYTDPRRPRVLASTWARAKGDKPGEGEHEVTGFVGNPAVIGLHHHWDKTHSPYQLFFYEGCGGYGVGYFSALAFPVYMQLIFTFFITGSWLILLRSNEMGTIMSVIFGVAPLVTAWMGKTAQYVQLFRYYMMIGLGIVYASPLIGLVNNQRYPVSEPSWQSYDKQIVDNGTYPVTGTVPDQYPLTMENSTYYEAVTATGLSISLAGLGLLLVMLCAGAEKCNCPRRRVVAPNPPSADRDEGKMNSEKSQGLGKISSNTRLRISTKQYN